MSWDPVINPEGIEPQFEGFDAMPPFDPVSATSEFSPVNAWWLSELCRLVYTPDCKERDRPWHRGKLHRFGWLEERTPFSEVHSFHKTSTHAAIFHAGIDEQEPFSLLCFRGTSKLRQWIMNLSALPVSWHADDESDRCVHQGFKILFDRIWPLIEPCLKDLPAPVFFTGHSLGGAFAAMGSLHFQPAALYTFGSPRIGNAALGNFFAATGVPHFRIVNRHDIVPLLPHRDARFGKRQFQHFGDPIHLGEVDDGWHPDGDPLIYLAKSFRGSADPPECILDHPAYAYSRILRTMATPAGI